MARPRVLISTDLGGNDKDDAQSMVHAMLYADKLDYRGFVMTRSDDGGFAKGKATNGEVFMNNILKAYAEDLPNLRSHSSGFPSAESLKTKIATGAKSGSFPGNLSEGAQLIVDEARDASPDDPLWVLTWGPIHDAAAAILSAPDIVPKIRLYSIAGFAQDAANPKAYNALRKAVADDPDYEDLFWIDNATSFRGMMASASGSKSAGIKEGYPWLKAHADSKGALGELLFEEYSHNITHPGANGLKMGDTPSLLYLIDGANDENPALKSWGGRFQKDGLGEDTWTDIPGSANRMGDRDGARTVYEHREAVRKDFAERLEWADKKGGGAAKPAPDAPDTGTGGTVPPGWKTPNKQGHAIVDADKIEAGGTTRFAGIDFADDDVLILRDFDRGVLGGISGGNSLQVSGKKGYARIDSLADLHELAAAPKARVDLDLDAEADQITLEFAHEGGIHSLVLAGLGREYDALF